MPGTNDSKLTINNHIIEKQILRLMKLLFATVVLLMSLSAPAQHYYKDIIGTRETAETIKAYQANKVSRVLLTSYDENNTRSNDFYIEQQFLPAVKTLRTITRSDMGQGSVLTALIDNSGNVVKTIDSSNAVVSITTYTYNPSGQLVSVLSSSTDSSKKTNESEQHLWQYNNNQVAKMLRIKNGNDTTYVDFRLDDAGNIAEEQETRRGVKSEPVYYYYDAGNRLTDIVRYNKKAKRLLPEYMFEYSPANQVIQKITVPSNSDNYLIWRYQYNAQGLKTKEVIYNKQKQLSGKVEYQYSFGS
jgi:YD repeat-containing protein